MTIPTPVEIPYQLKLSGAATSTTQDMIQMALVASINAYMHANNLALAEYAKRVHVDRYIIMGIQNKIIRIDQIKAVELYRLLTFHGYNMTIQVEQKQPADGVQDPFDQDDIDETTPA